MPHILKSLIIGSALLAAISAHAAEEAPPLGGMQMAIGLCGGLALFLYGMEQMTEGLKAAAGARMKKILARLTSNRFAGALTGAFVTAVIQSSSVTTVLVVGFVSAGLMSLGQSIGVIMGANIGTTVTAQIVAFKIVKLALVFIACGYAAMTLGRSERFCLLGRTLFGLGLIFFGMNLMGQAMAPLRSYQPFLELMQQIAQPALGIFLGAGFTALIQSSSATTGIIIVMASQGLVSLPAGIALSLGANIGTCITALLAAFGKPRSALRAASIHILFNVVGVLLWIGFIDQLAQLSIQLSPNHPGLPEHLRLAAETPRQIANANTLFNSLNTLFFIGFTSPLARLVERFIPDRPDSGRTIIETKFLDDNLITTPTLAINMARLEIGHLGEHVLTMFAQLRAALEQRDRALLQELEKQDDAADILYANITRYLSRVGKQELTESESREFFRLNQAAANFESIGDVLETDLRDTGQKLIASEVPPSETMQLLLAELYESVYQSLEEAVRAVSENSQRAAQEVISLKPEIDVRMHAAMRRQADSLAHSGEARLAILNLEFELTDKFKRIYTLSKRIARLWVPKEV